MRESRAPGWRFFGALAAVASAGCIVSLDGITGGVGDSGADAPDSSVAEASNDAMPPGEAAADSGASDSAIADATVCTPVEVGDGGPRPACMDEDGGADAGAVACMAASLTSFTLHWVPPRAPMMACDAGQITAFLAACTGTAPGSLCTAFEAPDAGNLGCVGCLQSTESPNATAYGPLIVQSSIGHLNRGGCVALLDPCDLPCAEAYESVQACEELACASCPVANGDTAFDQCAGVADTCSCLPEVTQANTCAAALASGPAAVCNQGGSFAAAVAKIGGIFCGGS